MNVIRLDEGGYIVRGDGWEIEANRKIEFSLGDEFESFPAGFLTFEITPDNAIEFGEALRRSGEAAKQLAAGSTQTVLDLMAQPTPDKIDPAT